MKILDLVQGSDEWLKARIGLPTASRFKDIITPAKADKSKSSKAYMFELIAEKLTNQKTDFFQNEWMQRGNELEPLARSSYEFLSDVKTNEVGIMLNDDETIGASPDGLIGDDGGIEIKCPKPQTMVKYMIDDTLPAEYKPQVMGNLWIGEREYWDFVAFHPDMKMFVKRVYRDEEYIKKMSEHILSFVNEMQENYEKIKNKYKV